VDTQTRKLVITVMNCPSRDEALAPNTSRNPFALYYHGNISADLLPEILLEALKQLPEVSVTAIGYTTAGNEDYPAQFCRRAAELGVLDRVHLIGPQQRAELLAKARECTIGWAAMPTHSSNANFRHMAGASNKAFDYLACGLALLVSDQPDWKELFLDSGYGGSCTSEDPKSVTAAIDWFLKHPHEVKAMGERGRNRVIDEWNYQTQFREVLELLRAD
jgi:glycosyltransferase involved in cell wall biosynthesis